LAEKVKIIELNIEFAAYLRVTDLAIGSLLCITAKNRLENSSTLKILSKCFLQLCMAFNTHSLRKF